MLSLLGSASARTADRMRRNNRHWVDPHPSQLLQLEARRRNRAGRVASGMTPPERARPEHPVHSPLGERERGAVRPDVLVETQLGAGAQHAMQLGQRARLIGHGAENQ